jgi:hypothetical protein
VNRTSRRAIPKQRRFALVRDPERSDFACGDVRIAQRSARGSELRTPDIARIVLDPAGRGKLLRKLGLIQTTDLAIAIEHDRARTRRSGVECEDIAGRAHAVADLRRLARA